MCGTPEDAVTPTYDQEPAIRVAMMPKDTNYNGTIFGGVILSYMDQAGAVEVRKYTRQLIVTVAMKEIVFKEPVFVGDLVSFYTSTERVGRTSVTVSVDVVAIRRCDDDLKRVPVTHGSVTYVAVDDDRHPIPIGEPMNV